MGVMRTVRKLPFEKIVMRQLPAEQIKKAVRRNSLSSDLPKPGDRIVKNLFCNVRCANVTHTAAPLLTRRGADDLPAQLRFNEKYYKAKGKGKLESSDTLVVRPDVPEWLAGLPGGWTDPENPCKVTGPLQAFVTEKLPRRLRGFSVFSGCGGLDLGIHKWVRTIAYCEWNGECRQVLKKRMEDGLLDDAKILKDISSVKASDFKELPDVVLGGFPCQDVSLAGKKAGMDGGRTCLFQEVLRLIKELRKEFGKMPHTVFLENVAHITSDGMAGVWRGVLKGLQDLGYEGRWITITADEVGLPATRARWILLATQPDAPVIGADAMPDPTPTRPMPCPAKWLAPKERHQEFNARLKMVGNILVPQQARFAWQHLQAQRKAAPSKA